MPKKNKRRADYRPPKECKEFGEVLKANRKRLGLSQKQVADMLGYQESSIGFLEAGGGFSSPLSASVPRVYQLDEKQAAEWFELRQMMSERFRRGGSLVKPEQRFDYAKGTLAERVSTFGRKLAMKRYEMGLSQARFAKAKGISINYVRLIELGGRFSSIGAEKVPEAYALSEEETAEFKALCAEAKKCMRPEHTFRDFKGALYIYTDGTKYEFPIYVTDSLSRLAQLVGVSESYVSKALSDYYRFGYKSRFRTTIEAETDDDEIEERRIKDYIEKRYGVCPP